MNLGKSVVILAVLLLSTLAFTACSSGDDDDDGNGATQTGAGAQTGAEGGSTMLTIVAESNRFDKDELRAPANTEVTLELENKDAGVLHNVSIYESSDVSETIYQGELFTGEATQTYTFETPDAGEYFFRCDVHPDTMTGTFIVE